MKTVIKLYVIISLLYSLVFSLTGDYSVIRHRAPFLVVELAVSTGSGYDQHGYYIAPPGSRIASAMVYNPLSNASDDIIARYDLNL